MPAPGPNSDRPIPPPRTTPLRPGFGLFLRLLWRTLFRSRGTFGHPTPRRVLVLGLFVPSLVLLQLVHRIGLLLDEFLFRGYRDVEVKAPLFITGIPRSGTTFLHRVLARDSETFTAMKLWEILLAPSVTERKLWMAAGRVDRALGGLGRRLLRTFEQRAFAGTRAIHALSLFDVEEDDFLLLPIFATLFLVFPFPFEQELWYLAFFDLRLPEADRKRIWRFYEGCVKRHLYVHGPGKAFLAKTPLLSPKIDGIRETFPDARVVACMRTPYEAVPSLISFMSHPWRWFGNDFQGVAFRDRILALAGHWYRHPMQRLAGWPSERHAFMRFQELMRDPQQAVTGLYRRFGLELSPRFTARLASEAERARGYRSGHSYSLEQFSLTQEQLLAEFRDVFEHFDFEAAYRVERAPALETDASARTLEVRVDTVE